ncbi:hypothetical protein M5Y95_13960, partial [Staphylococcus aureus]|uniref:hypothetical protein n=1 Tax=Staphylococcus aureus TaxID=1280 RepID=UPI0026E484C6
KKKKKKKRKKKEKKKRRKRQKSIRDRTKKGKKKRKHTAFEQRAIGNTTTSELPKYTNCLIRNRTITLKHNQKQTNKKK